MTVIPYDPNARAVARGNGGSFNADWLMDPAEIAQRIGGTDFVPRGIRNNPAAITAALLYGAEVGLGPMQSLARIAVIDGKPTLAAEAQRALILADGHDLWIEESTNTRCTIAGRRRGSDGISRVTWTLDDAKRARIAGKQNWQAYPRQMLLARASAELARAVFADVIGGLAATEELEDVDASAPAPAPPAGGEPEPAKPTRRRRRISATAGPAPAPGEAGPLSDEPASEPDPPDNEPPKPDAEPDKPNRAQVGLLFRLFKQKGLHERDARLAWSQTTLGRPIASSTELSALDVSRLVDELKALPDAPAEPETPDEPPTPPDPEPKPEPDLEPAEAAVLAAMRDELGAEEVQPGQPGYGDFPDGF